MGLFDKSFRSYDSKVKREVVEYSGLLGLTIGGERLVNIPSRPGYVYVRLRDNQSEVIQAINDKVSPIFDFPVLVTRNGNSWMVVGKDTNRYGTWMTSAPFLPQHGNQHSFSRDLGTGGDPVFVYPDQFMPLLVYPSGTSGAGMLLVAPYVLQQDDGFIYVGNTGTPNLLQYKPVDNTAILGLVSLNMLTGNPEIQIASGTPISASLTGTASILPYLPYPSASREPLYAFRLVSGTTSLTWNNLYNVRQFIGGGSITTGSSTPSQTFITGSVPFAGANGSLTEDNANLFWDESLDHLNVGPRAPTVAPFFDAPVVMSAKAQNNAVYSIVYSYGTGTSGSPSPTFLGARQRGSISTPLPVKKDDALTTLGSAAYDGATWSSPARIRFYADGDFVTGAYYPTRMEFDVTPSGSNTRRTQFQIHGDSVNIPTGSTYNIEGMPHTHPASDITSGIMATARLGSGTASSSKRLAGDSTWVDAPSADTNSEALYRCNSAFASGWTGTINGTPSGANVTVTTSTGNIASITPSASTHLAKMRLFNITRGTYALIQSVSGSVVALTANAPSGWVNGDSLTVISTTVSSGDGRNWCEFEITSGVTKDHIFIDVS